MPENQPKLEDLINQERQQIKSALSQFDQAALADLMVDAVKRLNELKEELQKVEQESDKLAYRSAKLEQMLGRFTSGPAAGAEEFEPGALIEDMRRYPLDSVLDRLSELREAVDSLLKDQTRYHQALIERIETLETGLTEVAKTPPPAPLPKPGPPPPEHPAADKIATVLSVVVIVASVFLMGFIIWLLTR